MIAAGKLDRTIRIERAHRVPGLAGSETIAWTTVATVRAELAEATLIETRNDKGVTATDLLTFRLRFVALTSDDRVIYDGRPHNIIRVREIGRRRALEIACEGRPVH